MFSLRMFYASIVPRKQKKPFIQSSDLPLNISHFRHPTPKLVEKTRRKAPIHQNIAYWFQTPGIIGETNFHPLSPTFNVDTHTKEWNSGQKTHRPTLKRGGGGIWSQCWVFLAKHSYFSQQFWRWVSESGLVSNFHFRQSYWLDIITYLTYGPGKHCRKIW